MQYEYKCVPAPMNLIVKNVSDMEGAVRNYSDIINKNATNGFEFYSLEQITCTKPAGCLLSLLGRSDTIVTYNMLIFRKSI